MNLLYPIFAAIQGFSDGGAPGLHLPNVNADTGIGVVLNIVFTLAGLLSVIFIIIGGVKYILSGGDSAGIKSAKETITYAIVGLIVTLLAFGIVKYVTGIQG